LAARLLRLGPPLWSTLSPPACSSPPSSTVLACCLRPADRFFGTDFAVVLALLPLLEMASLPTVLIRFNESALSSKAGLRRVSWLFDVVDWNAVSETALAESCGELAMGDGGKGCQIFGLIFLRRRTVRGLRLVFARSADSPTAFNIEMGAWTCSDPTAGTRKRWWQSYYLYATILSMRTIVCMLFAVHMLV
jgi:hypothetical protein